jgi:hypothetical protein
MVLVSRCVPYSAFTSCSTGSYFSQQTLNGYGTTTKTCTCCDDGCNDHIYYCMQNLPITSTTAAVSSIDSSATSKAPVLIGYGVIQSMQASSGDISSSQKITYDVAPQSGNQLATTLSTTQKFEVMSTNSYSTNYLLPTRNGSVVRRHGIISVLFCFIWRIFS